MVVACWTWPRGDVVEVSRKIRALGTVAIEDEDGLR
jgi:hypothetical protein